MHGAITPFPQYAFIAWLGKTQVKINKMHILSHFPLLDINKSVNDNRKQQSNVTNFNSHSTSNERYLKTATYHNRNWWYPIT